MVRQVRGTAKNHRGCAKTSRVPYTHQKTGAQSGGRARAASE
jgi:hypothetical protein